MLGVSGYRGFAICHVFVDSPCSIYMGIVKLNIALHMESITSSNWGEITKNGFRFSCKKL